jgi:hypothetical protein
VKLGFGETDSDEHENLIEIGTANTWQKIYWNISHIPDHERDGVRNLRVTLPTTNYDVYFDNIEAERLLQTPEGSNVTSTPNEYIQYRVILGSSQPQEFPTLYNIQVEWSNGFKIEQTNTNNVRLYNYTGDTQNLRLEAIVFGADLAEWYTVTDQSIEPGDMVSLTGTLDEYGVPILSKSTQSNDPNLVGGISTKAGQTLGIEAENRRLLALAGRIPVKVDPSSKPIAAGDSITSGPTMGMAKKAEVGEKAIGRALEKWDPESGRNTILILVAPGFTHGTDVVASKVGDLEEKVNTISQLLGLEDTEGNPEGVLEGLNSMAQEMMSTFSEFQTYANGLGLSTTTNEAGGPVLAVASDFAVTGATSLSDTTITGELNVGGIKLDPVENSLNVQGPACINKEIDIHNEFLCDAQTLYIQKSLTGNIDLFNGAIVIEPNGHITINGVVDAEVIIADEYVVKAASQTTGSAILPQGSNEIVIETTSPQENSKIFVTPTSSTGGNTLYIKGKINGVSFTVAIDAYASNDINFDWWILNIE